MRSALAEPRALHPACVLVMQPRTLHNNCPHSTTAAAAKEAPHARRVQPPPSACAGSNVRSPSATPKPLLCANRAAPQPPKPWRPLHPSARVSAQFGAVTERATRNPTKVWATTSDVCKDEPPGTVHTAACGPAVIPTTTVLSRRAAGGALLAATSAAANRGRDEPKYRAHHRTRIHPPPPSYPAADQGWNCRLSKKYLRR